MKIKLRTKKWRPAVTIPLPYSAARSAAKNIPGTLSRTLSKKIPSPYNRMITEKNLALLLEICKSIEQTHSGLEMIRIETGDGALISVTI